MDKYFYLAAQLPFLRFGHAPALSAEQFLSEAEKWIPEAELRILSLAGLNRREGLPGAPYVYEAYQRFELDLLFELSLWRQAAREGAEHKPGPQVQSLIAEGTPLEKEIKLLKARWDFLEELEMGHYFDLEFLIIYFLKLQVLVREFTFDKDKGTKMFDAVCEVKNG